MIYDITLKLSKQTPSWQNEEPKIEIEWQAEIGVDQSDVNVSAIRMGSHLGTHIDAPKHFLAGGASIDQTPLEALIGTCVIADLTTLTEQEVPKSAFENLNLPTGTKRLILKTSNTTRKLLHKSDFCHNFVALSPDAAKWVAQSEIELIGFDYLSAGGVDPIRGGEVHRILLGAGVVIAEGLDLSEVEPGQYQLICLPLKIDGAEASPARVVLMR